jgi:sterol 3beta-glucosyltransferase
MIDRDPERMTEIAVQALQYTGQRAILLRRWGGLQQADLPANVLMIDHAPHAWLFPRMAAVVPARP